VLIFDEASAAVCDLVRKVSRRGLDRVIAVAATARRPDDGGVWALLEAGAADVFCWDHSEHAAAEIAARVERWEQVEERVRAPGVADRLIGTSARWLAALREVVEAALFTRAPVLISGDTGTGKELVAHVMHELDTRSGKRRLALLDCTTVVPTLSGSEFFGHERGAFTGAVAARDGAFARADHGTLFLDEVGELPLNLQAELLRVTQEGTYKRVGSDVWRKTEFRLICATNRDLAADTAKDTFRRDFYYRIAGVKLRLPSLRERPEDILPLARHFLAQVDGGERTRDFDPVVQAFLLERDYPGNVRDLRHLVLRVGFRHVGPGPITIGDVPEEEHSSGAHSRANANAGEWETCVRHALARGMTLSEIKTTAADTAIGVAISDEGSLKQAARRLGVTTRALQLRRSGGVTPRGTARPPRDRKGAGRGRRP
jgi:transcriptional regulator with GAF, ATPase, and Fis domain